MRSWVDEESDQRYQKFIEGSPAPITLFDESDVDQIPASIKTALEEGSDTVRAKFTEKNDEAIPHEFQGRGFRTANGYSLTCSRTYPSPVSRT